MVKFKWLTPSIKNNGYGCGIGLWENNGVCYYCYNGPPRFYRLQRIPPVAKSLGYTCGDAGGFDAGEPGRLCPNCAIKQGFVW